MVEPLTARLLTFGSGTEPLTRCCAAVSPKCHPVWALLSALAHVRTNAILTGRRALKAKGFQDLFELELKDIYSAEKQLTKALPKMAKAATNEDLRQAFEGHLEETLGQVERLET